MRLLSHDMYIEEPELTQQGQYQQICKKQSEKKAKKHRSAMAKFRAGVAPLRLETGHYDITDEADRVCFHCADIIEPVEHVILHC